VLTQADDLMAEIRATTNVLAPYSDAQFDTVTAFKGWTINHVLRHLHVWNRAAWMSCTQPAAFDEWMAGIAVANQAKRSMRDVELEHSAGLSGQALSRVWCAFAEEMTAELRTADPARRVKWAGPDMSVRSSVSARLMETWAHGQEIYDVLGLARHNTDAIRNIVVLGINTFGWTFRNRRQAVPDPAPRVTLTAPSGEVWTFNQGTEDASVSGAAEEFCQVVTQVRNIGDTSLRVEGANAIAWMAVAQCFAGPPNDPPPVGSRRRAAVPLQPDPVPRGK
jgi:uncharacterized protein (TIGR03084 family)